MIRRISNRRCALIAAAVATLHGRHSSWAATSWTNALGGTWQTAANWNGGVPTAAVDAYFNISPSYAITLTGNAAAQNFNVSAGSPGVNAGAFSLQTGTINLNGGSLTLGTLTYGTAAAGQIGFSNAMNWSDGSLTINGGFYRPQQQALTLPYYSTYTQAYPSAWTITGANAVTARPTLAVVNGGSISLSDSSSAGTAIIGAGGGKGGLSLSGSGSSWTTSNSVYAGFAGNNTSAFNASDGSISVSNGAHGYINNNSYIGYSGGVGRVSVDGAGSSLGLSSTSLGYSSNYFNGITYPAVGTLSITNGGTASALYTYLYNGAITVDGAGSAFTSISDLFIGNTTKGIFGISNGGSVSIGGSTSLGSYGGVGTLAFGTGGGTLTTAGLIANSTSITGSGVINTRGLVTDGNLTFDAAHPAAQTFSWGATTVNLNTGFSSNNGPIGVGLVTTGVLTIGGGVTVNSAGGVIGNYSLATGAGTVSGGGTTWNNSGSLAIGFASGANGSLTIGTGATAYSSNAYIGGNSGIGKLAVDGAGSRLINSYGMSLGNNSGTGQLTISNSGTVSVGGQMQVGLLGSGTVTFGTNGATLTTQSLDASPSQILGSGTINASGIVSDLTINLDAVHGRIQSFPFGSSTMNLDVSGTKTSVGDIGAGWTGAGTLNIKDGLVINGRNGIIGGNVGGAGTVTVSGAGTTWTSYNGLFEIGYLNVYDSRSAAGTLLISDGGSVSESNAYLGYVHGQGYVSVIGTIHLSPTVEI